MTENTASTCRYGIYLVPADRSRLYQWGSAWLGHDLLDRHSALPMINSSIDEDERQYLVGNAKKYGFHATVKAPFRLAKAHAEADVIAAARNVVGCFPPLRVQLTLATLDGFLCLRPTSSPLWLTIASRLVSELDKFRAVYMNTEIDRERFPNLSTRQSELLVRWGYPYVFDEYRPHFTLTRRVKPNRSRRIEVILKHELADVLSGVVSFGDICVVRQKCEEAPFTLVERLPFAIS